MWGRGYLNSVVDRSFLFFLTWYDRGNTDVQSRTLFWCNMFAWAFFFNVNYLTICRLTISIFAEPQQYQPMCF